MTTGADVAANLATTERLVREAAGLGAQLVTLPEKWPLMHPLPASGPQPLDGPWITAAKSWASELDIVVLAGSVLEATPDGGRAYNTSVLIDKAGGVVATYRKRHLFDVEVDGVAYQESAETQPGDQIVCADALGRRVGMSVCYDLRFPEHYRQLVADGAEILAVPSAFTAATGAAHWHVLLRARAIENQCFVLAPNQVGSHANGTESYGHSLIVDPWGNVLAEAGAGEGVIVADLDFAELARIRTTLPALVHRRH